MPGQLRVHFMSFTVSAEITKLKVFVFQCYEILIVVV